MRTSRRAREGGFPLCPVTHKNEERNIRAVRRSSESNFSGMQTKQTPNPKVPVRVGRTGGRELSSQEECMVRGRGNGKVP